MVGLVVLVGAGIPKLDILKTGFVEGVLETGADGNLKAANPADGSDAGAVVKVDA